MTPRNPQRITPSSLRTRAVAALVFGGALALMSTVVIGGCGTSSSHQVANHGTHRSNVAQTSTSTAANHVPQTSNRQPAPTTTNTVVGTTPSTATPPMPTAPTPSGPSGQPTSPAAGKRFDLAGKVVVIDPGHNGGNGAHPEIINQPVQAGGFTKACDTTGTETNDGYPEHAFTFDVAVRTAAILRSEGASVILTRPDDGGVGPCVNERAAIGNTNHAQVAISIHADGGPDWGRGFHVLTPAGCGGCTNDIVTPSSTLGARLRDAFRSETAMPTSNYLGSDGIMARSDLGGLNLSAVPKVFIECGNMRNATDAGMLKDPGFRQIAAQAIADGLGSYLAG